MNEIGGDKVAEDKVTGDKIGGDKIVINRDPQDKETIKTLSEAIALYKESLAERDLTLADQNQQIKELRGS